MAPGILSELRPFFYPRAIAVVGVSQDATKFGSRLFRAIQRFGFQGGLYPVSPRGREFFGLKVYPSIAAIPGPVDLAHKLKPDLVLMDIRMPDMNGLEATKLIKEADIKVNVVILTVSDEEDDLFEALKIGANGYMLKDVRPELLFELLEGVFMGEAAITPAVATKIAVDRAIRDCIISPEDIQ